MEMAGTNALDSPDNILMVFFVAELSRWMTFSLLNCSDGDSFVAEFFMVMVA